MYSASTSAFNSSIFAIYAGPTKKRFLIHSAILAKSPSLRPIVDGKWKESVDRKLDLEEWDEQTVEQLVEWLYSGHYTRLKVTSEALDKHPYDHRSKTSLVRLKIGSLAGPSPQHSKEAIPASGSISDSDEETYQIPTQLGKIQCHGDRVGVAAHECLVADGRIAEMRNTLENSAQPGSTLVQDAKVYALAQYLQLVGLKRLAFHNIQDVLTAKAVFGRLPRMTGAIVDLSRYTYAHTDALSNSEEPLRALVSTFVAMWLPNLRGPDVDVLMSEGGDFVIDVMAKSRGMSVRLFRKFQVANAEAACLKRKIEDLVMSSSLEEMPPL